MEGFMEYAVEMGSGAMVYIISFIKIGSSIQRLIEGDSQTHRQHGDLISLLLFFQNKENALKSKENPLCGGGVCPSAYLRLSVSA
jgi:hypothetical protein